VHWLIDGMNLIGSRPDGWWKDRGRARRKLVGDLAKLGTQGRNEQTDAEGISVTVVFDGREHPEEVAAGRREGVVVRFAPGGPNAADDVIASMVAALDDPSETTVVTSDGALVARVRAAGAQVMGVRAFSGRLEGPQS
jgi:predicted RNA-binding protein with PIN domain